MDNPSIAKEKVLRKCLSLLPAINLSFFYLDIGVKKLTTLNLLRIGVAIQLMGWTSYKKIERQIRAIDEREELFGLSSISASQLSRRFNALPSTYPRDLFLQTLTKLKKVLNPQKGLPSLGKLHLVDSSSLRLPPTMGKWAYLSRQKNSVKFHTRVVVTAPGKVYPDVVIPSTGNVDDREVVMELVIDPDATHVMDRGYVDYEKMDLWVTHGIRFAIRVNEKHKATILETHELPSGTSITLDAKVIMGSKFIQMENSVRLVEFTDSQGRKYRIVTNRWDLTAEEVAEMYRYRWFIELFFKWNKQHLRLVKLQSTDPQGIWNQIYFAMTAYCLSMYIEVMEQTKQSTWDVLELLRMYAEKAWDALLRELHRKPERTSKGRQKSQQPRSPVEVNVASVAVVKPVGVSKSKTAKYTHPKQK